MAVVVRLNRESVQLVELLLNWLHQKWRAKRVCVCMCVCVCNGAVSNGYDLFVVEASSTSLLRLDPRLSLQQQQQQKIRDDDDGDGGSGEDDDDDNDGFVHQWRCNRSVSCTAWQADVVAATTKLGCKEKRQVLKKNCNGLATEFCAQRMRTKQNCISLSRATKN